VNVISYDWFDHYHKAVRDYAELKHPIKKYYKSASFAIEWLMTNVIFNLQESTFDLQPLLFVSHKNKKNNTDISKLFLLFTNFLCVIFSKRSKTSTYD